MMKLFKTTLKTAVSVISITSVTLQPLMAQAIVGDGSANAPVITTTLNGRPLVNINTPGANGLSYNTYSQFNVGPNGAILNNIASEFGSTLQGGLVAGNVNLAGGAATVILNEVLTNNPSALNGYLEVGGTNADVIIANPFGITCNGCGFLNTDHLTLTTGSASFGGGAFTGFSVDGGTIFIGNSGLDASATTRFDLISRQITFDGKVVGQDIRVIAGRNDVIYATGMVTAKADDGAAPGFGIDSTLLGGMYANAITLNSTEAGVGVRAPAEMAASSGGMTLTADGRLIIGKASTSGRVKATARDIDIETSLLAAGAVELDADQAIAVLAGAKLVSEDSIRASAGTGFSLGAGSVVLSTGTVDLSAGGALTTSGSATIAAGATASNGSTATADLTLTAASMDLSGVTAVATGNLSADAAIIDIAADGTIPEGRFIAAGNVDITANTLTGGLIAADGSITLTGDALLLNGGRILAQGDLNVTGNALNTGSQLQGDSVTLTALTGALTNSGILLSGSTLAANAATNLTNSGEVQAVGAITLTAPGTMTNSGSVETLSTLTIGTPALLVNIATGELLGRTGVMITADEVRNAGAIASSAASVVLEVTSDITNTGLFYAAGLLDLGADGDIINDGGALLADGAIALQGSTTAEAARIINENGGLIETFNGDIYLAAGVIQNLGPDVVITEQVVVETTPWVIQNPGSACSGTVEDCHRMRLSTETTTEVATLTGEASQIVSSGNLIATGGDFSNTYSLMSAVGDIALNLDSFTNTGLDLHETVIVTENHSREVDGGIFDDTDWYYWDVVQPATVSTIGHVFATIEAGGDITGVISGYVTNGAVGSNGPLSTTGSNPDLTATGPAIGNLAGSAGNTSGATSGITWNTAIFKPGKTDSGHLLAAPEYFDLEQFISSDALLNHFLGDAANAQLRLGDAYVETLFVRRQLFELTGEAPIDERERMRALYDNAIAEGERLDLRPGVALTPDQIAALQEDIIWLETVVIDGREVLIPRVYLAARNGVLLAGASLKAENVTLWASEFTNSGLIAASNTVYIKTEGSFLNLAGSIKAGDLLALDVGTRFTSLNGYLTATDISIAAEDIAIRTEAFRATGQDGFADSATAISTLNASNDIQLYASNDIELTGARLGAGGDIALQAGGDIFGGTTLLNQSVDYRDGDNFVFIDNRLNLVNQVTAGGNLSLIAGAGDIVLNGGSYTAGQVLTVAALGGSVALNAVADTQFSDSRFTAGNWLMSTDKRDQVFDLKNQVVTLDGAQIDVYAAGNILADGTRFRVPGATLTALDLATEAPNGNLTLTAEYGDIWIGAPTDIHAETHLRSTSILGGLLGSTSDLRTLATTHVGSVMTVAGNIALTTGGDLTLIAADITAGGAFTTNVAGNTTLLAAVDLDYRSLFEMSNNGIIITTETSEDLVETAFHTRINAASVSFDPTSPITIAAYRDAFINGGHPSGWLGDGASGHMALADSLLGLTPPTNNDPSDTSTPSDWRIDLASYGVTAELPTGAGFEYLSEVAARPDTTLEPIILLDYSHYEIDRQISPAAMALLSLAVGQFVGGLGFIQGIESAFLQGFAKAGLSSIITQTAAGVVSGEFDLGEILKGAAFAGLGAGLSASINLGELVGASPDSLLGIPLRPGETFAIFSPGALVNGLGNSLISSSLSVIQNGGSFGDALASNFGSFLMGQTLAATQFGIGEMHLGEGTPGHAFLHGVVGCAFAEASGGDCAAGAAAAIAQSFYAGYAKANDIDYNHALNTAELIGAFAGFLFSGGEAANVSLAAQIAQSGFANNYLTHDELVKFERELRECRAGGGQCQYILEEYLELSHAHNAELAACYAAGNMACVERHLIDIAEAKLSGLFDEVNSQIFAADPLMALYFRNSQLQTNNPYQSGVDMEKVWQAAGAKYRADFASNNCQGMSGGECNAAFDAEVAKLTALAIARGIAAGEESAREFRNIMIGIGAVLAAPIIIEMSAAALAQAIAAGELVSTATTGVYVACQVSVCMQVIAYTGSAATGLCVLSGPHCVADMMSGGGGMITEISAEVVAILKAGKQLPAAARNTINSLRTTIGASATGRNAVLIHNDQIIGISTADNVFYEASGLVGGKLVVKNPAGGVGYFDEAGLLVSGNPPLKSGLKPNQADIDRLNTIDPATKKLAPGEAEAAALLELELGVTLGRSTTGDADFVILTGPNAGQKIDFLYAVDGINNYTVVNYNKNFLSNFSESGPARIQEHLEKANIVPLDFRNLTQPNRDLVLDYVHKLPPAQQAQILILE